MFRKWIQNVRRLPASLVLCAQGLNEGPQRRVSRSTTGRRKSRSASSFWTQNGYLVSCLRNLISAWPSRSTPSRARAPAWFLIPIVMQPISFTTVMRSKDKDLWSATSVELWRLYANDTLRFISWDCCLKAPRSHMSRLSSEWRISCTTNCKDASVLCAELINNLLMAWDHHL